MIEKRHKEKKKMDYQDRTHAVVVHHQIRAHYFNPIHWHMYAQNSQDQIIIIPLLLLLHYQILFSMYTAQICPFMFTHLK